MFRFGLEAAHLNGPFRVQAEYMTAHTQAAASDVTFQAGYVEAAYVFGGKNRNYSLAPSSKYGGTFGIFGAVEPEDGERVSGGGFGVWEAAARFSALDLSEGPVQGGTEHNFTAGLNWYPEKNLRVMLNYVRAEADDSPGAGDVEADIFQGRVQLYF